MVATMLRQQRLFTYWQRQQASWLRSIQPTFQPEPEAPCDPFPPVANLFLDGGEGKSEHLQRIVTYYPDTELAREARRLLGSTASPVAAPKLGMIRSNPQP